MEMDYDLKNLVLLLCLEKWPNSGYGSLSLRGITLCCPFQDHFGANEIFGTVLAKRANSQKHYALRDRILSTLCKVITCTLRRQKRIRQRKVRPYPVGKWNIR